MGWVGVNYGYWINDLPTVAIARPKIAGAVYCCLPLLLLLLLMWQSAPEQLIVADTVLANSPHPLVYNLPRPLSRLPYFLSSISSGQSFAFPVFGTSFRVLIQFLLLDMSRGVKVHR